MSSNSRSSKNDLAKFILAASDANSEGTEQSRIYLESEGVKVDEMLEEGLKRIKKIQLQLRAQEMKTGMRTLEDLRNKVEKWVENLMADPAFSFAQLVQKENLVVSFRNVQMMKTEDIKEILVKHYTLKRLNDESEDPGGV